MVHNQLHGEGEGAAPKSNGGTPWVLWEQIHPSNTNLGYHSSSISPTLAQVWGPTLLKPGGQTHSSSSSSVSQALQSASDGLAVGWVLLGWGCWGSPVGRC